MNDAVRLMLDEDVDVVVAAIIRSRGVEVVTVSELGRYGITDEGQLEFAREVGRVLFTHNRRDFEMLAKAWSLDGRDHAGIITGSQTRSPAEIAKRLLFGIDGRTHSNFANLFLYI